MYKRNVLLSLISIILYILEYEDGKSCVLHALSSLCELNMIHIRNKIAN